MFPVISVDQSMSEGMEGLGTKRKFWYYDDGENRTLFKAEERGTGEDWAEKIACELCELLGLPHVHYELAKEVGSGTPGVVCRSCAPRPISLVLGNQLLFESDSRYPRDEGKYKTKEHTVEAVVSVLEELQLPATEWLSGMPNGITSALEVFTGYLLLDAWIANQDRHHENWAALRDGETLHLSPTFDHGAALARNESDQNREERLSSKDRNRQIPIFARRARSAIYENSSATKPLGTHDLFRQFAARTPKASDSWRSRLRQVETSSIQSILDEIPGNRMSPIAKKFTLELLLENQQRLLSEEGGS